MIERLKSSGLIPDAQKRALGHLRRRWRYISHITLRAGLHTAWRRQRIRWARRSEPDAYSDDDPFAIVTFPTGEIRFKQARPFDKHADAGRIIDGDWDREVQPLDDHPVYHACLARFGQGKAWRDTAFVQATLARVAAGEARWHGCRSIAEVDARCREVDALYESIAAKGYRRRAEVSPNSWRAALDEVTVNLGRDGTLIHNSDGLHRLAIARVLGIAEIPVRILVRHRTWHDRCAAAAERQGLPARASAWSGFLTPAGIREVGATLACYAWCT